MTSETAILPFGELLATNSTDTAFTANAATATEPTGAGIIDLGARPNGMPNTLLLVPFGAGAGDTTFDMRVTGWAYVGTLWVPVVLAEFNCTLGTATGVAGQPVANTDQFVDTITLATAHAGSNGVSVSVVSPAGNLVAHALVDCKGFGKIEIEFDPGPRVPIASTSRSNRRAACPD
jgi:hypothetical protein